MIYKDFIQSLSAFSIKFSKSSLFTLHFSPSTFHFFTLHPSVFTLHPSPMKYYENFCKPHLVNYQLIIIISDKIMFTSIIFTLYRKASKHILNCRNLGSHIAFPQSITSVPQNFISFPPKHYKEFNHPQFSPPRQLKVLILHGYGEKITFCILCTFLIFFKSV